MFTTTKYNISWASVDLSGTCDFVSWSPKGQSSVQRIDADEPFIATILQANRKLWKCVVAPEVFEMRTPRNLEPFVLH